jgi:hypothetical protein
VEVPPSVLPTPIAPKCGPVKAAKPVRHACRESEIESAIQLAFTFCNAILQNQSHSLYTNPCATIQICVIPCSACSASSWGACAACVSCVTRGVHLVDLPGRGIFQKHPTSWLVFSLRQFVFEQQIHRQIIITAFLRIDISSDRVRKPR